MEKLENRNRIRKGTDHNNIADGRRSMSAGADENKSKQRWTPVKFFKGKVQSP